MSGSGIQERKAQKVSGSSQAFAFEDVPAGSYRVEIRDPRFEPWSKEGVEPGTATNAKLKGSAALALRVVDDVTKEPVKRYALDIRYENTNRSPNSFRILEPQAEPPADGFFAGIVPAEATAIVRADGYSSCEIPLPYFAPNEHRDVEARLVRATKLMGRVVSGPERTPIAAAKVEISPKRPEDQSGVRRLTNMDPDAKSTESDASGGFAFDNMSVGEFTLRASLNKLLSVEQAITITPSTAQIELMLPARSWLAGKVTAPAGADLTGLKLLASPAETKNPHFMLLRGDDVSSPLSSDGSFRVGPIPAGSAKVSVLLPDVSRATSRSGWSTSPGPTIDLGLVDLAPNTETRRDFDLGENCPGILTFRVTADAASTAEYSVYIENTFSRQAAGYVPLDATGKGRSGPVLPGTYAFSLLPIDGSGSFPFDQRVDLGPNQTVEVVLSLQLFAGTLRVLDSRDGKPLGGQQITLVPDGPDVRESIRLQTDADGRVSSRLPVGRYRVVAGDGRHSMPSSEAVVFIDWSASGASPAEVRLSKPPGN